MACIPCGRLSRTPSPGSRRWRDRSGIIFCAGEGPWLGGTPRATGSAGKDLATIQELVFTGLED